MESIGLMIGEEQIMNQQTPKETGVISSSLKMKYQAAFILIGFVNNFIYVIILSSSQDIATHFNEESFMSLLPLALVVPSIGIIFLNSVCLLKTSHRARIFVMLILSVLACGCYALFSSFNPKDKYAFFVCVGVALVSGANQSIGEGVMIAFVKKFPSDCISGWSSGTGLAGLLGSGLYLFLKSFSVPTYLIFSCIIPLLFLYGIVFVWLDNNQPAIRLLSDQKVQSIIEEEEVLQVLHESQNVEMRWSTIWPIVSKIWFSCINITFVYYFEYTILTCFADVLNLKSKLPVNPSFVQVHAYQILSFMYQLGVFTSRSSLYVVKVSKWEVLTLIQLCNFVGWFTFSFYGLQIYAQFVWMVFVGLIGGMSYVNIFYFTLQNQNKKLEENEKELAINVLLIATNLGVTSANLSALLLSNTIFINK